MSSPRIVLAWTPPGGGERRCAFSEECTIGRDPSNRILVSDATVSRVHARISLSATGLVLANESSSNTVLLNDRTSVPPGGQASLDQGDQLRIGTQILRVAELSWTPPMTRCVNPTCQHEVPATQRDCPWCGTSLAFAQTQFEPRS